jgi:hypothetical protein
MIEYVTVAVPIKHYEEAKKHIPASSYVGRKDGDFTEVRDSEGKRFVFKWMGGKPYAFPISKVSGRYRIEPVYYKGELIRIELYDRIANKVVKTAIMPDIAPLYQYSLTLPALNYLEYLEAQWREG